MTVFGPDISSYQAGLNLSRLADASFVIAKASEGTYYTDADYQGWRRQAAQLGKPFAWYHFLTTEDAHAQAAHTAASVGDKSLPGMVDVEPNGSSKPNLAQALAYADAAKAAGLNLRLVYLPHWYWQEIGSPGLGGLASRGLSLVSSAYPGGSGNPLALYPGDGASGWAAYGGVTPALYQYTNQASDGGLTLDYNAYRGTLAQLTALLAGASSSTGDDDVTPQDIQAIAAAVYAYGREDVNLSTGVMHNVPLGNLAHGAWVSVNDPNGPVISRLNALEAQVKALAPIQVKPAVDTGALSAVIAPLLTSGATPDEVASAVAAHLAGPTAAQD